MIQKRACVRACMCVRACTGNEPKASGASIVAGASKVLLCFRGGVKLRAHFSLLHQNFELHYQREQKKQNKKKQNSPIWYETNIFFKPSDCVYIPSPLFFSTFFIGCFPQSVLRKQIMVSVQVWLQSTDQKRNVMEGHLFFYSSCAVTHCLWVKKRNSALWLIWQSRAAKNSLGQFFF